MDKYEDESLEALFGQIIKLHRRKSRDFFGSLGIYRGQPAILFKLWERDGIAQKEIAESIGSTPATVTIMLRRMEKAGFIERRSDTKDRRSTLVFLTEKGRVIRGDILRAKRELNEACFNDFSTDERVELEGFFRRIIDNLAPDK